MKEKEESNEVKIILFIVSLPIAIGLSFYVAWASLKTIEWFNIPLNLTIMQLYGISSILGFLTYSSKKDSSTMSEAFSNIIGKFFVVSFVLLINLFIKNLI